LTISSPNLLLPARSPVSGLPNLPKPPDTSVATETERSGYMLDKLRKRLKSQKGFTLIELLVVMIILAILTAIAIPSYLSFRDRANKSAAGADLRAAIPSVEAYFSDTGAYTGMTATALQASYDQSLDPAIVFVKSASATDYCVYAVSPNDNDKIAYKAGPNGTLVVTTGGTAAVGC
jgi:prepilin-type N-terminal cleavage/methylation domain-containing protein